VAGGRAQLTRERLGRLRVRVRQHRVPDELDHLRVVVEGLGVVQQHQLVDVLLAADLHGPLAPDASELACVGAA
jgi:hypothetical protein